MTDAAPTRADALASAPVKAALYLRVSTGRQAENDLSIPDQASGRGLLHCQDRQGQPVSLLHMLDQGTAGRERLPRFDRADGQARSRRRGPSRMAAARSAASRDDDRRGHIADLRKRAADPEAKLKRLYEAIENDLANISDPSLKDRIAELTAIRDQAQTDAERAAAAVERLGPAITPDSLRRFAVDPARAGIHDDFVTPRSTAE
jgi:hypothetical protein